MRLDTLHVVRGRLPVEPAASMRFACHRAASALRDGSGIVSFFKAVVARQTERFDLLRHCGSRELAMARRRGGELWLENARRGGARGSAVLLLHLKQSE